MKNPKTSCPHCGKKNTWQANNSFRPFCSERCKLIDLGKWADESHRIPGRQINEVMDEENDREDEDEGEGEGEGEGEKE